MEEDEEKELLKALEPVAKENIGLLSKVNSKKWWSSQFFKFMEEEDYGQELLKLRTETKRLSSGLLVVLIGNTITEEALPNYSSRLANLLPDKTGVSEDPWAIWQRGWNSEEDQHERVLNEYLLLTGRVNMQSVEKSIFSLIQRGFKQSPDIFKGLLYPMFQEPATRVSHLNVAKKAREQGDRTLESICHKIAGDEHRHAMFYFEVCKGLFDLEQNKAMIKFYELLKDGIVMPAYLMTDNTYTTPPALFNHFADVAIAERVYTPADYAGILADLNKGLNIASRSVSGDAAKAQEALLSLPSRIERIYERRLRRTAVPVPFEWIYSNMT